ncbi:DNA invertase Pin-like site-specific DNA recombinase [Methylobacter tundripaludum]|uniref:DNA invertase Pin-like site-specific DNA recombinase n=1 Tax=Methylobacter tundripaludum TaxID=173365 RepID=A0A2S6HDN6_9GAMM|nr:recombinase family protein [Methylobacter tundripaludum]PPK75595.1 DNA invertase Pin-like site-specific DNA recombinase [Methylobacter tundripaludum]
MANGKFVTYYRVSTQKQGQSGLGLEAQEQAVLNYLNGGEWELIQKFVEVETGKGSDALDRRPQLKAALEMCKKQKATLLIAVLDRLGRNVHFISGLMESGIDFVSVESPNDSPFMLHVKAAVAEEEGRKISARTKAALQAAKVRGAVLGKAGAANLKPNIEARKQAADAFAGKLKGNIEGMKARGLTQRAMVAEMNMLGIKSAKGGEWSLIQLQRVMNRVV